VEQWIINSWQRQAWYVVRILQQLSYSDWGPMIHVVYCVLWTEIVL